MIQDIKAPISTQLVYNHKTNRVALVKLLWDGKEYKIKSIGLHYTYRKGRTLFHVFAVSSNELSFKLLLNTDNLFWSVDQVSDGLPD